MVGSRGRIRGSLHCTVPARTFILCVVVLFQFFGALTSKAAGAALHGCGSDQDATILSHPFCNKSLSIGERSQDLVSRLTLTEKISQLVNAAPEISRLGVPKHEWWNEALHGVAESPGVSFAETAKGVTSFPQPILTAASFNKTLWTLIGEAISTEGRAMYNLGQSGLTYWAPNINIFRDPRWGRGQETPGEDPFLTSVYAITFVKAMQEINYSEEGNHFPVPFDKPSDNNLVASNTPQAFGSMLKTSVCCKHFTAYDLENWDGYDRYHFNAKVSNEDLEDTYNPPFKNCVEQGHASSVMCSYNRVNGIPACADYNFLTATARQQWGLNGYIVSDCDAVQLIYDSIGYVPTGEDATAITFNAGMDLNCGTTAGIFGQSAVDQGKLNETTIDGALVNLFQVRMRLGEFEGDPQNQIYGSLGASDICSSVHQQLALEAATQGIVLLKNDGNTLPLLRGDIHSLAVIGPNANATLTMLGNYAGTPCGYVTPIQGLQKYVSSIQYEAGCADIPCESDEFIDKAIQVADGPDATILIVGLDQTQEKETLDRTHLRLPGQQENLVAAVANSSTGPVILVVMCGGAVDISFAKHSPNIQSIIWVGYPGQAGGDALADIIFGHRNPGGKLPVSWYPESYTDISMLNMGMRPVPASNYPGRTYRYYTGETVYDFGDGLSYTNFSHYHAKSPPSQRRIPGPKQIRCFHHPYPKEKCADAPLEGEATCEDAAFFVRVLVRNEGVRQGTDVVLLYAMPPNQGVDGNPLKQLVGFQSVQLDAQEQTEVAFHIFPCKHLATVGKSGFKELQEGYHTFMIGNRNSLAHHVLFHL
ncbi:unnamed protein product [Calypogeia fissa]